MLFRGIQYSGQLKSRCKDFNWSKRGCFANGTNFEWDLKSSSPTICNPYKCPPFGQKPFEIPTKTLGFCMVWFSNGQDQCYNPTFWKPDHLKSNLQKAQISNVSRFLMVGFQIATELWSRLYHILDCNIFIKPGMYLWGTRVWPWESWTGCKRKGFQTWGRIDPNGDQNRHPQKPVK